MTATNFDVCLAHVLKWEGGYIDHPDDPGGATNMGITIGTLSAHRGQQATKHDVRILTLEEAGEIYRKSYWAKVQGNDLPDGMDLVAFDAGVNSGPYRGIGWLQQALGVPVDGIIGPVTLRAAQDAPDGVQVIERACAVRLRFLRALRTWATFGRGWGRRLADTEAAAVAMHTRSVSALATLADRANKTRAAQSVGAGGVAMGGPASSLLNLTDWVVVIVVILSAVAVVILTQRAVHNAWRAAAYHAKLAEVTHA